MTRRERMERRIERRLDWAAGRRRKVEAYEKRAEPFRGDIAFNTQPGHIPERARLLDHFDRTFRTGGDYDMAKRHESKAAGIQAQLDKAIFSDDPDAPERLAERIAELEARRERYKAENRAFKQGDAAYAALVGMAIEEAAAKRAAIARHWHRVPHPTYELNNLGSNIRRCKERLQEVERRQQRQAAAEAAGGVMVERHGEYATVTFAEKPARAVLDALRAAGFHWRGGHWLGKADAIPAEVENAGV